MVWEYTATTSHYFLLFPVASSASCSCVDALLTRSSNLPPSPAFSRCLPMSTTGRSKFTPVYNRNPLTRAMLRLHLRRAHGTGRDDVRDSRAVRVGCDCTGCLCGETAAPTPTDYVPPTPEPTVSCGKACTSRPTARPSPESTPQTLEPTAPVECPDSCQISISFWTSGGAS